MRSLFVLMALALLTVGGAATWPGQPSNVYLPPAHSLHQSSRPIVLQHQNVASTVQIQQPHYHYPQVSVHHRPEVQSLSNFYLPPFAVQRPAVHSLVLPPTYVQHPVVQRPVMQSLPNVYLPPVVAHRRSHPVIEPHLTPSGTYLPPAGVGLDLRNGL